MFFVDFCNNVEDRLGHVIFDLVWCCFGSLNAVVLSQNSGIPSLGASGAIAGVMGAYILRFPRAQVLTLVFLGFFITTVRIPPSFF